MMKSVKLRRQAMRYKFTGPIARWDVKHKRPVSLLRKPVVDAATDDLTSSRFFPMDLLQPLSPSVEVDQFAHIEAKSNRTTPFTPLPEELRYTFRIIGAKGRQEVEDVVQKLYKWKQIYQHDTWKNRRNANFYRSSNTTYRATGRGRHLAWKHKKKQEPKTKAPASTETDDQSSSESEDEMDDTDYELYMKKKMEEQRKDAEEELRQTSGPGEDSADDDEVSEEEESDDESPDNEKEEVTAKTPGDAVKNETTQVGPPPASQMLVNFGFTDHVSQSKWVHKITNSYERIGFIPGFDTQFSDKDRFLRTFREYSDQHVSTEDNDDNPIWFLPQGYRITQNANDREALRNLLKDGGGMDLPWVSGFALGRR